MAGGAPSVRHGYHLADLTILTGRNLPKIRQPLHATFQGRIVNLLTSRRRDLSYSSETLHS
jgi:hypothetical protein